MLVENEFKKLQTFDSIYRSSFEDGGTLNCSVFQSTQRYFKRVSNTNDHILSWNSKGLCGKIIKPPSTSNNILNSLLNYVGTKIRIAFKGSCLEQDKISLNHGKIVNIFIVYQIIKDFNKSSFPTPENCLVQLN